MMIIHASLHGAYLMRSFPFWVPVNHFPSLVPRLPSFFGAAEKARKPGDDSRLSFPIKRSEDVRYRRQPVYVQVRLCFNGAITSALQNK